LPFGQRLPRLGLMLALGLAARHAAAEAPTVQLAPGFVYVPGESGEVGCLPPGTVETALQNVAESGLDAVSLDADFVVVLTAGVLTCPAIFYLPLENDVSGIGYAHEEPTELFDRAPDRRLAGVAFLNDLPYWQGEPDEFETAFLHEIGHRWLARVHANIEGNDVDLTGREGDHWSYFFDSGGSPLEGNLWLDGEGGAPPTAHTPAFPKRYSPFDLYLMGAFEADEVPPSRLLVPSAHDLSGCDDLALGPATPPQTCAALEVPGTFVPVGIEDVIRAEGERSPSAAEAPSTFTVAFLLLDPGGKDFDSDQCESLTTWTQRLVQLFADATEGRLILENAASTERACGDLTFAEAPHTSGCQLSPRPQKTPAYVPFALALALLGLGFRLRGRVRHAGGG
jgi:hypothetical protein